MVNIKLAREVPIELWVNNKHLTSFLCSPYNLNDLALGHLLARMYIDSPKDIVSIDLNYEKNQIKLKLKNHREIKHFTIPKFVLSGVSSVEDFNDSIYHLDKLDKKTKFPLNLIISTSQTMISKTPIAKDTGGVHAAVISDINSNYYIREDIGRHSAVDKSIGAFAFETLDFSKSFISTTGRLSLDMVLKAISVGVPVLVSLKRPSDLAFNLAQHFNITLIGNILNQPHIFTHKDRII